MDYGKVLRRAWEITWRWKVLWILGFLASLGNGAGGGGGSNFYSSEAGQSTELGRWFQDAQGAPFWAAIAGVVLALLCLFLLIAIVVWVVSIIARGGLIAGVQQVEEEGTTSFGAAWRVGVQRFWTLFGIAFLAAIPAILLGLILATVLVLGIAAAGGFSEFSEAASAAGIVTAVLCSAVLCCGLIVVSIVLDQIRIYAERAAVLDGLGWIDAFKRGWQVIKDHLGPTVILWLLFLVIGFVVAAVVFGVMAVIALPFIAVLANVEPGAWMIAPACCGGLVALVVFGLIGAVVETFTSATWTLAYRELTGSGAKPSAELAAEA